MIKICVYHVFPYIAIGDSIPNFNKNNGTDWLRETINMLYNRNKERLKVAGVIVNLFHNHDEVSGITIPRYPLIQYQRIKNDFFVVGINEGTFALEELFIDGDADFMISENLKIKVKRLYSKVQSVIETNQLNYFKLTNWLPFSNDNFKLYKSMRTLQEKVSFLERILKIHLVKDFSQYLDLNLQEENTDVKLTHVDNFTRSCLPVKVNKYTHDFQPFTVTFSTNLQLPEHVCLGNGKVYGFGLVEHAPSPALSSSDLG